MAIALGTENKKKTYLAIGLLVLLVVVAVYELSGNFFGGSSASPPAPTYARTTAPAGNTAAAPANGAAQAPYAHQAVKLPAASALDPTLHPEVMAQAESTVYAGTGRNIFSPDSAPPVHIEKPAPFRPAEQVAAAGPPPPPPIDLKFYGYSSSPGAPKQIFLLHGDDIFLAHEGDVVDRRYRVVSIQPFSVQIEDLPYHDTQSIPLTQN